MSEPLTRLLAELPSVAPDPVRAERVKMRCRSRLAHARTGTGASRLPGHRVRAAWQPLIVILGVAYLAEVIVQAAHLYGF